MIRPLRDRLVIKEIGKLETVPGLIVIDTSEKYDRRGVVVAVGPGLRDKRGNRSAPPVAVGDTVIYADCIANHVRDSDGIEYVIIGDLSVAAVVNG